MHRQVALDRGPRASAIRAAIHATISRQDEERAVDRSSDPARMRPRLRQGLAHRPPALRCVVAAIQAIAPSRPEPRGSRISDDGLDLPSRQPGAAQLPVGSRVAAREDLSFDHNGYDLGRLRHHRNRGQTRVRERFPDSSPRSPKIITPVQPTRASQIETSGGSAGHDGAHRQRRGRKFDALPWRTCLAAEHTPCCSQRAGLCRLNRTLRPTWGR